MLNCFEKLVKFNCICITPTHGHHTGYWNSSSKETRSHHLQHTEGWTRWLTFCRQHFLMIPLKKKSKFHWSLLLSPIDNKSSMVQVMVQHWSGIKRLPQPLMSQISDINVSLGLNEFRLQIPCKGIGGHAWYCASSPGVPFTNMV